MFLFLLPAAFPTSPLKWERRTPRERSDRPSTCGRPSRRSPSRSDQSATRHETLWHAFKNTHIVEVGGLKFTLCSVVSRSGGAVLGDQERGEGGRHHDLLRLWFPWRQLSVRRRGRFPGSRLLPRRRHRRRHALWLGRALDARQRQPRRWDDQSFLHLVSLCSFDIRSSSEEREAFTTNQLFGSHLTNKVIFFSITWKYKSVHSNFSVFVCSFDRANANMLMLSSYNVHHISLLAC